MDRMLDILNVKQLWSHTKGEDVVVMVLDSGLDINHSHFNKSNIIITRNFLAKEGYENDVHDNHGHGTAVASVITSVVPDVKLIIGKVLGSRAGMDNKNPYEKPEMWSTIAIRDALQWALDYVKAGNKLNIINMSLGSPTKTNPEYESIITQLNNLGVSIVAACGNGGDGDMTTDEILYPAYFQDTISVGAIDIDNKIANFSSSNREVDVVSFGVKVPVADIKGGYRNANGTSYASPFISGCLALYDSYVYKLTNTYPSDKDRYVFLISNTDNMGFDRQIGFGFFKFPSLDRIWIPNFDNRKDKRINIKLKLGSKIALVNDKQITMDTEPFIDTKSQRTLVPLRFIAENLGCDVDWIQEKQQIVIRK